MVGPKDDSRATEEGAIDDLIEGLLDPFEDEGDITANGISGGDATGETGEAIENKAGDIAGGGSLSDEVDDFIDFGEGERGELADMVGRGDGMEVAGRVMSGLRIFLFRVKRHIFIHLLQYILLMYYNQIFEIALKLVYETLQIRAVSWSASRNKTN